MEHRAIVDLPVDKIVIPERSKRYANKAQMTALALSIRSTGLMQPAVVFPLGDDKYQLVSGGRRYYGKRMLGETHIGCIVLDKPLSEAEYLKMRFTENAQRVDPDPMEEARIACRYMDATSLNASQAARDLCVSNAAMTRFRERVCEWRDELQQAVESGLIPASTGHAIHAMACPEQQLEAIRRAAGGELTRDAATAEARQSKAVRATPSRQVKRAKAEIEGGYSVTVNGADLTLESFITCLETVLASARRAFRKGVTLESFLKTQREHTQEKNSLTHNAVASATEKPEV